MAVTININGLSLCHKASGGVAIATVPDVCKTPTPGGPVPIPYPNVAYSKKLAKGTKTVKVDGGNMAANKGSEFSSSIGDEPGTLGGVKSGTNMKEATWLTYSFDVKFEGKGACRLTDKMLMNHGNTACLGGFVNPELLEKFSDIAEELQILCDMMCEFAGKSGRKQDKVAKKLKEADRQQGFGSKIKAEVPFMGSEPIMSKNEPLRATNNYFHKGSFRPDATITNGGPPFKENIRGIVEMKFGVDNLTDAQKTAYEKIAGKDKLAVLEEGENCTCDDDGKGQKGQGQPVNAPVTSNATDLQKIGWGAVATIATIATIAAVICPFDGPLGDAAFGSGAAAAWSRVFATVPAY